MKKCSFFPNRTTDVLLYLLIQEPIGTIPLEFLKMQTSKYTTTWHYREKDDLYLWL